MDIAYTLKLIFTTPEQFILLPVSKQERDRFLMALETADFAEQSIKQRCDVFHYVSTTDGRDLLINIEKLKACNALVDPDYPSITRGAIADHSERETASAALSTGHIGSDGPLGKTNDQEENDFSNPASHDVLIGLEGCSDPIVSAVEIGTDIYDVFFEVEREGLLGKRFQQFLDIDGEPLYFNLEHVTYIQAPTWLVQQGRDADTAQYIT